MSHAAPAPDVDTQQIEVDEVLPHSAATIWKTLTSGDLIGRWLMVPTGFEAVEGRQFTFKTKPAGAWDGTIRCEVLEVVQNERLVYSWQSGDEGNVGYGAPLNTVVVWKLTKADSGTRLQLVHSGFTARNDTAFKSMGDGWKKVVPNIGTIAGEFGK